MSFLETDDSVNLFYDSTGEGSAIVFVHEFADNYQSWNEQIAHFSGRYRCISYNARGYPPSEVPNSVTAYSLDRAVMDLNAVLEALEIDRAHIVGLSMGSFAALHFGMEFPDKASSLVVAGCGYGSGPGEQDKFRSECEETAQLIDGVGAELSGVPEKLSSLCTEVKEKDPQGWERLKEAVKNFSPIGLSNTIRGIQKNRMSLWEYEKALQMMDVPTLIVAGDDDETSIEPSRFLKRTIPNAGLAVVASSSHTINLDRPEVFNFLVQEFFSRVDLGKEKFLRTVEKKSPSVFAFGTGEEGLAAKLEKSG